MSPELHQRVIVLGWTLVHSVWQLTAIGALFGLALLASRRANVRYAAAAVALFLCALAPVVTFCRLSSTMPESVEAAPTIISYKRSALAPAFAAPISKVAISNKSVPQASQADAPWTAGLERYMPLLVGGWLAGFSIMCVRIGGGLLLIHRRKRAAWAGAPEWQERLERLAKSCEVFKSVRVLFSTSLDTPIVVGILRATILFPASALSSLSVAQIEALLAHELAHVKRHDFLVNLIQSAVEAALFYHPVVWWISSTLRKERELCCDDVAVKVVGDPIGYARALASFETFRIKSPQLALHANGGHLMHRIQRLVLTPQPASAAGFAWLPCLLAIAMSGATAGTVATIRPELVAKPVAILRQALTVVSTAVSNHAAPKTAERPRHAISSHPTPSGPEVSGLVLSSFGKPVAGADVVLTVVPINPHDVFITKTDKLGKFKLTPHLNRDQKPLNLYAFRKGDGLGRIGVDGTWHDLVVKLQPSTKLHVKLQYPDGRLLGGIRTKPVLFIDYAASRPELMSDLPELITNEMGATSERDGIATFSDLPRGQSVRLSVDSDLFMEITPSQDIALPSGPSADASLTLQRGAVIQGRLLRNGKGVPGQQVQAYGGNGEDSQRWTDANGYFRLPKLSQGSYVLFAQLRPEVGRECTARGLPVQLGNGELKKGVDLVLIPGVPVAGTITGSDGKPLKDVDVRIAGPTSENSLWEQGCKTDANGNYRLRVPAGKQFAYFWSKEHWLHGDRAIQTEFEVREGQSKRLDWKIPPVAKNAKIQGVVLGPDGRPVPNATVTIEAPSPAATNSITSGPNGKFTLEFDEALAPKVLFRAFKDDLAAPEAVTAVKGKVTIRLQKRSLASVEGDLVDPDGKPVPNVTVAVMGHNEGARSSRLLGVVKTDVQGHFLFPRVLPTDHVAVYATGNGLMQRSRAKIVVVSAGSHVKTGPIVFEPENSVTGTIRDSNGVMPGVKVTLRGFTELSATTDAHGVFRFRNLPPGKATLRVELLGRQPLTVNVAGGARLDINLVSPVQIKMTLEYSAL